jgi:hypothetical protein
MSRDKQPKSTARNGCATKGVELAGLDGHFDSVLWAERD